MKKNNIKNNDLEKEITILKTMVMMRLLTIDELKEKLKEIGDKFNLQVVLREHNTTTDKRTIEYI